MGKYTPGCVIEAVLKLGDGNLTPDFNSHAGWFSAVNKGFVHRDKKQKDDQTVQGGVCGMTLEAYFMFV